MPFIESYFNNYQEFFKENALLDKQDKIDFKKWLLDEYNIVFAYYSVLDLEKNFHYYLSGNYGDDNQVKEIIKGFPYTPILDDTWILNKNKNLLFDLLRSLFKKNTNLSSGVNTPKFYQHYNHQIENQIHDLYRNTLVQTGLLQYEVQVVLAEEILFFISLKDYEENEGNLSDNLKDLLYKKIKTDEREIAFNFHQLVKYVASVEGKLFKDENAKLNKYFEIRNTSAILYDSNTWETKNEGTYRGFIDETLVRCDNFNQILEIIEGFFGRFITHIKGQSIISESNLDLTVSLSDIVSRFDVKTIKSIWEVVENKCMWDILIFPMYKSFRYNHVKIDTLPYEDKVTINNPVLFHSYVKPVYLISDGAEVDESVKTIFGFHLTKEVCKHYSKQIIEDVFVKQTIQHSLLKPQINNFIAKIMSKNLSHTDGSHVMVDFEKTMLKKWDEKQFKLYNQHLRNTMELVADVSGQIGMQSNYEYSFNEFLSDLRKNYFSSFSKSKCENGEKVINKINSKFLGTGLNDGEAHSIIEFCEEHIDKPILFPGGEIGKTAFISILKNIFRNLKKHSKFQKKTIDDNCEKLFQIKIELNEIENDDNDEILKDDYYKIVLTEESQEYDEAEKRIGKINKHLVKDRIVNTDGKIKEDGWGLLEAKICSAYLIGLPLDEYIYQEDETFYKDKNTGRIFPNKFIYADKVKSENKYKITHNFYMRKPKFATIWLESVEQQERITEIQKWKDAGFVFKLKGSSGEDFNNPTEFALNVKSVHKTVKQHNFKMIGSYHIKGLDQINSVQEQDNCIDLKILFETELNECQIENLKNDIRKHWLGYLKSDIKKFILVDEMTDLESTDTFEDLKSFTADFEYKQENYSQIAVLDNHAEFYKQKKDLDHLKKFAYYEVTDTSNNKAQSALKNATDLQKIETFETKVAIWDERIQNYLETTEEKNSKINKNKLFNLKGIDTPCFNLDDYFGTKNLEDLAEDLKEVFSKMTIGYVILHFSGFETIVKRTELKRMKDCSCFSAKSKENLVSNDNIALGYNYLLWKTEIKDTSKFLIFTSGKGIPSTIPHKSFFMPLTTLEALIKTQPKLNLVIALNSIRKINKNVTKN